MKGIKCNKSINFDLSDKALQSAYPKQSHKHAWDDIKKFMVNNGFEHRLYSGYNSIEPMLDTEIHVLIDNMKQALPWLTKPDVIREIDVTDIGETLSLKHLFTEKDISKERSEPEKTVKPQSVSKGKIHRKLEAYKQKNIENYTPPERKRTKDIEIE